MMTTPAPSTFIQQALELATQALFISTPNPRVGCVLVAPDGRVIGKGFTKQAGGPHAEIMALRDAAAAGADVRGATAYVTLEPCAHQGRTGPCCDALIAAGIGKVVASLQDPNPSVAGQGFARLRAAGVEVLVGPGAEESRQLNLGFFSRMLRGTPWVRMKLAASLDGVTALQNGTSQWITSPQAREDGHAWRARACTVLTGIGTVLADNPRLDVRAVPTPRQPTVAVLDSDLRTPPDAHLLSATRTCLIYAAGPPSDEAHQRQAALEAAGATVLRVANASGQVDLPSALQDLARRGTNELHVEAGQRLNGALLHEGLVDELLVYLAPKLLGPGRPLAALPALEQLAGALEFEFCATHAVGPDLRLVLRAPGHDQF